MIEKFWFTHIYKTDLEIIDFKDVKFDFVLQLDENRKNWYVATKVNNQNIKVLIGDFSEEVTDETFLEFAKHLTSSEDVKNHLIEYINTICKQNELGELLGLATKGIH